MTSEEVEAQEAQDEPRVEVSLTVQMLVNQMREYPAAAAACISGQINSVQHQKAMPDVSERRNFIAMWQASQRSAKFWNNAEKRLFNETAREIMLEELQATVNKLILKV